MILPGEVRDAEMSSFSSDFQTLKHFYLLYELLMSLRNVVRLFISLETSEMFRHFLYPLLKKLSLSLGLLG